MRLEFHDEDSVISYLMTLPHFEFERAVKHGQVALVTRMFGFPRGYFVREIRRMRRNLAAFERGVQEGFEGQQKTSLYRSIYGGGERS